jgi:hypothetical protein
MKVFLLGKIDLMLEEVDLEEAESTLPVWFKAAYKINMNPDFGGLFTKGYVQTVDGHPLNSQGMLPTQSFFEAFYAHSPKLIPDTTANDSASATPDLPSADRELSLRALQAQAHSNSRMKGWWEAQTIEGEIDCYAAIASIPEKLCLIHSETSEALEDYRNLPASSHEGSLLAIHVVRIDEKGAPVGFAIEIADIVIRVLDLAGALGIDLQKAVETKMSYNATRPHRHGGKRA